MVLIEPQKFEWMKKCATFLSIRTQTQIPLGFPLATHTTGKVGKVFTLRELIASFPFVHNDVESLVDSTLWNASRWKVAWGSTAWKVHRINLNMRDMRVTALLLMAINSDLHVQWRSWLLAIFMQHLLATISPSLPSPSNTTCHKTNSVFYMQTGWWRPVLRALRLYCFHHDDDVECWCEKAIYKWEEILCAVLHYSCMLFTLLELIFVLCDRFFLCVCFGVSR